MDNNIGEQFRKLRKSKNLTLKEASNNIISHQFLSKFEKGETKISLEYFIDLLSNLNVDEYEFFLNYYKNNSSQEIFLNKLSKAVHNKDSDSLKKLSQTELDFFSSSNNIRHKHNAIIANQYDLYINNIQTNNINYDDIKYYLLNINNWTYYEITLFNNSIFFLDYETISLLSKTAFKRTKKINSVLHTRNELSHLIMNIIFKFICDEYLDDIPALISLVSNEIKHEDFIFEKNRLNYLTGLYHIKKNNIQKGKKLCLDSINILKHFEFKNLATNLEIELHEFLVNNM